MRFLVTGATGFAGSHMINRILLEGDEVVAMVRNLDTCRDIENVLGKENIEKVEFVYGDLSVLDSISNIFANDIFDGVFHLGGLAHPPSSFAAPLLTSQTNVLGTAKICDEIIKNMPSCVLMQCSSPAVYGTGGNIKIKEGLPMLPNTPYGVSKAAADMYVLERASSADLRVFITRAFSHTGPRRASNQAISSDAIQVARILKDQQEPVIKIGNMTARRTVADVRDIVDVYYKLMIEFMNGNIENGDIFHIAGNDLYPMQYYLDLMLDIAGLSQLVELEIEPKFFRKVDIPVQIPDDSKVRELLNWSPAIPIEKTLEDLVNYWLGELDHGN